MKTSAIVRRAKGFHARPKNINLACWEAFNQIVSENQSDPLSLAYNALVRSKIKEFNAECARRLEEECNLRHWLATKLGCAPSDIQHDDLMAHELAWVDLLIAEFEAKGD